MLTSESLDEFAHEYYLNQSVATIGLEERAQLHSVPRLIEAIGGRGPVLELGFGTGLITGELLRHGIDLHVVEGAPSLVDEARRRHPGLVVHESMFESFMPATPYGAVLALHVLEHVDDPVQLLEAMRPWLVDDGALIAVVPNAESYHRRIAVEMGLHDELDHLGPSDHLVGHQRVYDLDTLTADLDRAGFDVTFDFGYLLKTVPNAMMLDYPSDMVDALNTISDRVPTRDLANIGVRAIPRPTVEPQPARAIPRPTIESQPARGTDAGLVTALVLTDGDPIAAGATVASVELLADDVCVLDRSQNDWTDTAVVESVLEGVLDEWILVLAAGEQLRVADRDALVRTLEEAEGDAITVHVGLSAEVRLHRNGPGAMDGIGSAGDQPCRSISIGAADRELGLAPATSVIVPTFNRARLLRRCLQGLAVQTTDDFEVIVVNDGGLPVDSVVDEFRGRLDIALVDQPHNGGAAAAANAGLAVARGRYAHFQADDDTIHPHHLELLITAMDEARDRGMRVGVVFGPAMMIEEDEAGNPTGSKVVFREEHHPDRLLWQNFIVGGTAMFDRALAVEIGGMNTDYEVLEDWDFWLRMTKQADLHYVDHATAEYRMRAGLANVTTQARPRFYDSLLRLYEDHPCEPGSLIEGERARQIESQTTSHQDSYAWDHTVAVIGTGDLAALAQTLSSVVAASGGRSIQLIVHALRTPDSERVLADLAEDATLCLHAVLDDTVCRERIRRQAGGRHTHVLRAGEILDADALIVSCEDEKP